MSKLIHHPFYWSMKRPGSLLKAYNFKVFISCHFSIGYNVFYILFYIICIYRTSFIYSNWFIDRLKFVEMNQNHTKDIGIFFRKYSSSIVFIA